MVRSRIRRKTSRRRRRRRNSRRRIKISRKRRSRRGKKVRRSRRKFRILSSTEAGLLGLAGGVVLGAGGAMAVGVGKRSRHRESAFRTNPTSAQRVMVDRSTGTPPTRSWRTRMSKLRRRLRRRRSREPEPDHHPYYW